MGPRAGVDRCGKSRSPTGIRSPCRPARSSVAIPTELPGPWYLYVPPTLSLQIIGIHFDHAGYWFRLILRAYTDSDTDDH